MPGYSEFADELLQHGTSTLCEASGVPGALDTALRPVWPGATIIGTALPVRCAAGDNLAIHLAVAQASPGDVLVVDGQQYIGGYWGEILTVAAQARGLSGLVIDGGVRDIAALEKRRFPVFARGVGMRACVKVTAPPPSETVAVAGVPITRGDLIVADADGVCAIPQALVERTLAAARQRTERESSIMQRLQAGETTVQILGLAAKATP
ncbi:MAG: dimethylmenaquinone methyltransferase [Pseudolabrys sp.]|jgi:4-hydroxy-4-methyl-2-oxoglutarate aldolase